jgi:bifunctional non-homologous end joining protein LigD
MPAFRPVQLATLVDHVPSGDRWLHEMKYDGYRCLIAVGGGEARVYTRSGLDWSDHFTGVVKAAAGLNVDSALIDGEAVVLDSEGKSRHCKPRSRAATPMSFFMPSTCSS